VPLRRINAPLRLVLFLPTDHEDTWPDWRDRNLNGLKGPPEGTLGGRERHYRLRFEVEMMNPTSEICFIHMADGWKVRSGHWLLLFAPLFDTVEQLLLIWRSQREAPTLRGIPSPFCSLCMFCLSNYVPFWGTFHKWLTC
jgi:hypothetical protein